MLVYSSILYLSKLRCLFFIFNSERFGSDLNGMILIIHDLMMLNLEKENLVQMDPGGNINREVVTSPFNQNISVS